MRTLLSKCPFSSSQRISSIVPACSRILPVNCKRSMTRIALGQRAMAAPTSSSAGACSKISGWKPACRSVSAAVKPPMPPPMIAIWTMRRAECHKKAQKAQNDFSLTHSLAFISFQFGFILCLLCLFVANNTIGDRRLAFVVVSVRQCFLDLIDQTQRLFTQRSHKRIAREVDQLVDQVNRVIDQSMGAAVLWRLIVNPEQHDSHRINPQQVGKFCAQVFRNPNLFAF